MTSIMPCSLQLAMQRVSTSLSLLSRAVQNVSRKYCYGFVTVWAWVLQSWVILRCPYVANSRHPHNLRTIYMSYPTQKLSPLFYVHVTVHRNQFLFSQNNGRSNFFKFIFVKKLYMFRAVPLPIIRSSPLYIRQWYMSCKFDDSFKHVQDISLLHIMFLPAARQP